MGKIKGKAVGDAFKVKHAKNKKNKLILNFDEDARRDYLTGFKKRKDERRKIAQEAEIAKLKEEKREIKAKKREEMKRLREKERGVPEMEHLFKEETKTYELEDHTVQITDVTHIDFVGSSGVMLGSNNMDEVDKEESEKETVEGDKDKDDETESGTKEAESGSQNPDKGKGKKPWKKRIHINKSHLMNKKRKGKKPSDRKELVRKQSNKRTR